MNDLDDLVAEVQQNIGFSDEAWKAFQAVNVRNIDLSNEVSRLRDVARRAAVLIRWFSRADYPHVVMSIVERSALDADARALAEALQRHGYYAEGWGE